MMMRTEGLDSMRSVRSICHWLQARGFAITAHRVTQTVVDRLRGQQGFDKRLTVAHRQYELLMLLNGPPRGILGRWSARSQ